MSYTAPSAWMARFLAGGKLDRVVWLVVEVFFCVNVAM